MRDILLSIIVCTFNRAELLEICLQSLVAQTLDQALYEVIIVDNNSTDNTQTVAQCYCSKYNNVKIVKEKNVGLSFARNRGFKTANGEFIAYIDDDAKAYPDWCEQLVAFMQRHPEVKVFGGPYYPFSLKEIPSWFPPQFGSFDWGEKERELNIGPEWICGSNMVYHHSILTDRCKFDEKLGMSGNATSYGEETKLLMELSKKGIAVYYVPEAKVYHLIADYKMHLSWLLKSAFLCGKKEFAIYSNKKSIIRCILRLIKHSLKSLYLFCKYYREPLKRRIYYSFRDLSYVAGSLYGRFL